MPISWVFFLLEAGGEGSPPSCSTRLGNWGWATLWIHPSHGIPQCPVLGNTIPRDGIGEVWWRNDLCECVHVLGVGLVCFFFLWEKVNHSASRFGLALGAAPTAGGLRGHAQPVSHGVTVLAVPCLCQLVHMCIIVLYR